MKNFTLLGVVDLLNKCALRKDEDLCEDCRYNLLKTINTLAGSCCVRSAVRYAAKLLHIWRMMANE